MKILDQGTDITTSGSYSSSPNITNETSGSQFDINFTPSVQNLEWLESALNIVRQVNNRDVKANAINLLAVFKEIFTILKQAGYDITRFPPLRAIHLDDDSLLIEWVFTDIRIGFSFEIDPIKNSWYLVTNKKLEELSESGYLTNDNFKSVVLRIFDFVLKNS